MPSIEIIQDCQWGSTGKGLFAGYLAEQHDPDVLAMAPSPNAGHTYITRTGQALVHRMLPLGITSHCLQHIVLGPGSLIDLDALHQEILQAREVGLLAETVPILVHEAAAVVLQRHRDAEADGGTAPGSTRKGVGAAQIDRVKRSLDSCNIIGLIEHDHPVFDLIQLITTKQMQQVYFEANRIQVEGCQGYSLSVYHGQYPYTTCRDVTATSLLADVGMPMRRTSVIRVYGVFRTYPIRVANRPASGEWSGPTYPDSIETTFEALGQAQELTTVTKLPRRIFTFSHEQAIEACVQNRVDTIFLNFCQYCPDWPTLKDLWLRLEDLAQVGYMGFGPQPGDIVRIGAPSINEHHLRQIYENYRTAA